MLAWGCGRREGCILLVVGKVAGLHVGGIGVPVDPQNRVASATAKSHVQCVGGSSC